MAFLENGCQDSHDLNKVTRPLQQEVLPPDATSRIISGAICGFSSMVRADRTDSLQLFLRGLCFLDGAGTRFGRIAQNMMNHFRVQGFLVADLIIKGSLVDAGPPGDFIDARPGKALLGKASLALQEYG